ncbi:CDP-diacylglycerol--serine O-phosphatidyltransferase [Pseudomonas koreensis]|jgi:CDP-diacylglycerol--serine O-phosphatidyltransferase|uniref:CDP-diacylglycerol--serine O-phosphatidyltransferase n=1 Tax=Pseudomonas jessenii TaxID=77298 RepID=A0A5C4L2I7_PSEJE|nr:MULTISPECIES: CDP-diacylglycerol--serine O-phosphatidyltransferase [Pseudomonas]KAA8737053.1 CDP-diacylglycerol--serine O-phosphatidyltransferase [Pseudomonas koreensis]MBB6157316.1 CDP-diacylglycerol--serine O-phosphatidyltransferase [Pseudomonas sp. JAI115]MBY8957353.1 CDP-diacylglycerol--serine O-phosphatidyltransferase [Pseudomonas sp. MIS38]QBR32029.1 CDP-diacylglycerol--serine O-phosphatidyltransferase [Pseudomonas sp. S150]RON91243.1 phosphatidylserine synthase [Pseudomonas fluoresce
MPLLFKRSLLPKLRSFPLTAEAVTILSGAAEFRRCLLEKIAEATRRIYIVALYLQHDEAGQEILDALHAAKLKRPELEIVVVVDWLRAQRGLIGAGKQPGNSAWYQEMTRTHQSEVPVYGVPVQTRELFGVLHLKGFVIDDCVVYSGASLNNVYLHKFDKYRFDRYHVLHSRELADSMHHLVKHGLIESKAVHRLDLPNLPTTRSLRNDIGDLRSRLKYAAYDTSAGSTAHTGLSVSPLLGVGKNNPLNRVIVELIASAQQQLTICTPYFNLPLPIIREVNRALARGVKIDIVVGDKTANDFYIPPSEPFKVIAALPYLYEISLRRFAKRHQRNIDSGQLNLHLWRDGDNSYHLKGMWVDQRYTLLTGNNLNPRAFRLDLENALLIDDPQGEWLEPRAKEQQEIFRNTTRIASFQNLETLPEYPAGVAKFLKRVSRVRIERLLYRIL